MPNVSTVRQLVVNPNKVVCYITIFSDGTEETDMIVYDSSVAATALGKSDPLDCAIMEIYTATSSSLGLAYLEFEATTDVLAWSLPCQGGSQAMNFEAIGGLPNYAGTGITGDISLTTTLLEPNSALTIVLVVRPR
jgi:hypothetical protein